MSERNYWKNIVLVHDAVVTQHIYFKKVFH